MFIVVDVTLGNRNKNLIHVCTDSFYFVKNSFIEYVDKLIRNPSQNQKIPCHNRKEPFKRSVKLK